jgi:hypothetical protein
VIDPTREELASLNLARRWFPPLRKNKRPDLTTLYRWTKGGCRGVVLESVQVGGTRCTSREAVARFIAALSELSSSPVPVRSSRARARANEKAEEELDRLGL